MVNCPKCGFSQPKDQYCAKCGVDMVVFRPAPKPFMTRLITNTTFQVVALGVVVGGATVYVKEQNRVEFARRISQTPIARNAQAMEDELAAQVALENEARERMNEASVPANLYAGRIATNSQSTIQAQEANLASTAPAAQAPVEPATAAPVTPPAVTTATPAQNAVAAKASTAPKSVRVWFMESSRRALTELLSGAQQASSDGVVGYGVVGNIEAKLNTVRGWQSVDSTQPQDLRLNQPNVIFRGTRDEVSGQNLGFTIQVVPVAAEDNGELHFQIDANRLLRGDPATGLDSFNFVLPENFTVPKGSAVILTGALPRRALFEGEERSYRGSQVLRLMTNERFRSGATEFAIVIEAR